MCSTVTGLTSKISSSVSTVTYHRISICKSSQVVGCKTRHETSCRMTNTFHVIWSSNDIASEDLEKNDWDLSMCRKKIFMSVFVEGGRTFLNSGVCTPNLTVSITGSSIIHYCLCIQWPCNICTRFAFKFVKVIFRVATAQIGPRPSHFWGF